MRTEARFPGVTRDAGQYESFYVKAARPGRRPGDLDPPHRTTSGPARRRTASLWFTLFDAAAAGPRASKVTVPAQLSSPAPDGRLCRGRRGAASSRGARTGTISGGRARRRAGTSTSPTAPSPFRHLPYERLYSAPAAADQVPLAPIRLPRFDGTAHRRRTSASQVERWPGMIGHNWGAEHAERWAWVQGSELDAQADAYLDVAARQDQGRAADDAVGRQRRCCASTASSTGSAGSTQVAVDRGSTTVRPGAGSSSPARA